MGENEEALKYYEKAYAIDPEFKEAEEIISTLKTGS